MTAASADGIQRLIAGAARSCLGHAAGLTPFRWPNTLPTRLRCAGMEPLLGL